MDSASGAAATNPEISAETEPIALKEFGSNPKRGHEGSGAASLGGLSRDLGCISYRPTSDERGNNGSV